LAAPVSPPEQLDIGPSLALAGVGLVIGFLLGTVYGQRLERHRRSRVRF
jgi:Na+/glutamate symporter